MNLQLSPAVSSEWLMLLVSLCLRKSTRSKTKQTLMSPVGNIKLPGTRGCVGGLWDFVGGHFTSQASWQDLERKS